MPVNIYNQLNNVFRANPQILDELRQNIQQDERFEMRNNKLYYIPLNIEVIRKEELNDKLNTIYQTNNGMINNVVAFYKMIRQHYLNVTRDEVEKFLKSKHEYQMSLTKKRTSAPIISLYSNKTWAIDLIDFNLRIINNYRYIITVIDIFSKKCWLRTITNKSSLTVRNAFDNIITEAGTRPKLLMADNGNEMAEHFKTYCNDNNIKIIHTRSNSPQANGIVENKNKQVRRLLNQYMLRNNNPNWTLYVQAVAENLNNKYNKSIKASPNDIWANTNNKYPAIDDENEKIQETYRMNREKITNFRETDRYAVGDRVRIKMTTCFADLRSMTKAGNVKNIVVHYTPEIYTIHTVTPRQSRNNAERYQYKLTNAAGLILSKSGDATKAYKFYGTDLLKIPDGMPAINITNNRALQLNKSQRNANDINGV
jgi:transposase InsO family protein